MSNPDIAYYPGCSGKGSSEEYDWSTRAVMHHLGVTPVEIEDWSLLWLLPGPHGQP